MKLNSKSQLALRMTDYALEMMFQLQWDKFISKCPDKSLADRAVREWIEMFSEEFKPNGNARKKLTLPASNIKNRNYLMTQPALNISSRIKIDEGRFDVRFLSKIPDKKITFMLDRHLMIRYRKSGNNIFAVRINTELTPEGREHLTYLSFKINIDNEHIDYMGNPDAPLTDPKFIQFLQLLIFTELSELETVVLKPKEKTHGTRRDGKYVNESSQTVVIVDSTWNKTVIREDGFSVRGHLRLQACGKDLDGKEARFYRRI